MNDAEEFEKSGQAANSWEAVLRKTNKCNSGKRERNPSARLSTMAGRANPVLVVLSTLGLILLGLALNLGTALFPLLLWVLWRPDDPSGYYYLGPILVVQFWHLRYLWIDKDHLASYRFLTARTFSS